ncbi:hypothetical protein BDA96_01G144700 [Sorghum bicolor]|uniref:VQ domain-containing protein n=2 Tax=Sorghum bicolor TaxID=4558 RepID=A0A921RXA3_SORBI|nr:uncharacterized protein LOC8054180 [Sorghum bicolor]EER91085.1 hypothetical protein SORBI_3001G138600 [Sorghum bicolor]KAG0548183.1 hypothetical protein BDA96_01G144700 [Sorghum bicolor]|eukprot:XP_002464087.1 uncharacterized protein LOC8054180 [Sorghum bicolor]
MDHGDRRSGATGRPWRGAGAGVAAGGGGPPPPKVYRVEPRDFRELVQRLTGAGTPSAAAGAPGPSPHQRATTLTPAMVTADSRRAQAAAAVPVPGPTEQFDYASWFSAPLLSPAAYGAPGFGGGHQQHQGSSGPLL